MIVTSIWIFLFISITRRALQHLAVFSSRDATHISSGSDMCTPRGTRSDNDKGGSNNNGKANVLHLQSK